MPEKQLLHPPTRPWQADLLDHLQTASRFILANFLWVLFSLPILTLPAATAALFAVMLDMVRGRSPEPLSTFLTAMRHHWPKSTALALLNLAIVALITLNLLILGRMNLSQFPTLLSLGATILAIILILLVNFYAWPLLILLDPPLPALLSQSFKLALAHPAWTLLMTAAALSPLLLSLLLPRAFLLFLSFATASLITTSAAYRIIQRYL